MLDPRDRKVEERQLALLVASVRDYAIFLLDPTGHILSWNAGARALKGYEADEIIGRHFSTFYTDPDRERDHPANELEIAEREGRYAEEGWRVRKDGSTFWASVTITALRDDDGRLTGFAKVTRDLTERRAAEQALHAAVEELRIANAELDRFASVAAHDMTDPLRTISGFAELIAESDLSPQEARDFGRHILDSSLRLTGMLRGLLTYARAGRASATSERVRVGSAVRDVLDDLAGLVDERAATVDVEGADPAVVVADPHDVRIVLQNLLSNAVKFADPAAPAVTVRAEPAGEDGWRVTVADNGAGIPVAEQARIFTPFARAAGASGPAGYGLGLAICHRLVERHGGTLGVESPAGGGSAFWFTLPAAAP